MGHLPKLIAIDQELLTPFRLHFSTESDMIKSLPQTFSLLNTEMLKLENCNQIGGDKRCTAGNIGTNRN